MSAGSALRRPFPRLQLLAWYQDHGRHDLPWRHTRDPYRVLVSEVMLQQTQVSRVLPVYSEWIERWPTVRALARASQADVIRAWSGMGYNRRAIHLWRAANAVATHFEGVVPASPAELDALPGVGPYTAAAVASFAGERRVAVRDTNVGRVIARARLGAPSAREAGIRIVEEEATALLPRSGRAARDHNLALMDLGALVCTARRPACDGCPLRRSCAWLEAGRPAARPLPSANLEPFEDTARFARGRIVETLRTRGAATLDELAAALPPAHAPRLSHYLAALERDGLIVEAAGAWSLPR